MAAASKMLQVCENYAGHDADFSSLLADSLNSRRRIRRQQGTLNHVSGVLFKEKCVPKKVFMSSAQM